MKIILVLLATVALSASNLQLVSEWNTFKRRHNKQYKPMEDVMRKNNYYRNKERIASHNFLYNQGVFNFKLGINQFADWTEQEFYNIFQSAPSTSYTYHNTTDRWIGGSFSKDTYGWKERDKRQATKYFSKDWRTERAVNPIRDQTVLGKSQCNAGWAFATVAALEAHDSKYPSGLQQFSEQNLIDCISREIGCGGMTPRNGFEYVLDKGNINKLSKYPYEGGAKECRYDEEDYGTSGIQIVNVMPMNEDQLLETVAEEGVVVVGFDPLNFSFMFYASGIYDERRCKQGISNQLHYMNIVGFEDDPEAGKYWIVRNSFGTSWGESGYMRVPRDANICGIAYQPIYLIV
ncbi:procathepsin L-like [Hermetia illucens]|nr:procathepsin L-like [Hermetia illucens]XP_037915957.1 procathepsin L-like [Hermetia illucens]